MKLPTRAETLELAIAHDEVADGYEERARMNPGGPRAGALLSHRAAASLWRRVYSTFGDLNKVALKKAVSFEAKVEASEAGAAKHDEEIARLKAKFRR